MADLIPLRTARRPGRRIGYNRAARIMETMEGKGIVGPENGSSPREILADLDNY